MTYQTHISESAADPAWDQFIQTVHNGHHVQSSLWSRLKAGDGWNPLRLIVKQGQEIVAGCQILLKRFPLAGAVGYVANGPVIADSADMDALYELFIAELRRIVRSHRIQALFIQPPKGHDAFVPYLTEAGCQLSSLDMSPRATVIVDIRPEPDEIMAQMKQKTRYNIRYAGRNGVTVREGGKEDLVHFHRLLNATSDRQEFSPESLEYFERMYEIFEPEGRFKLLLSEHEGTYLSGIILIAYADTVIYKRGGWSGEKGNLHPNEALQWYGMNWAKKQGHHFYNLEGINRHLAEIVLSGESIPQEQLDSLTRFKLGFGGEVLLLPQAYIMVYNPILRWGYNNVYSRFAKG